MSDKVQLRVGTTSAATTANDTLLRDSGGAEVGITDDRTAGVGNVRGWLADPSSMSWTAQHTAEARGIWATPADLDSAVAAAVIGLLDFKGATNCSANPNYPAALKGDTYVVSVAGKIGGASGKSVDAGDMYLATADNAGGTEASVGTSWSVLEHNLVGALLGSNNLSDVASASAARTNLGLAIGTNVQAWDTDLDTWATKAAPSGVAVGTTDTQTLTNKRVTPRALTVSSSATPAINTDNGDVANILALATNVTSMTTNLTGTPTDGQRLLIRFKDTGTAKTITWGLGFLSSGVATLLATTSASKTHHVGLIWDAAASVWRCLAVDAVGY